MDISHVILLFLFICSASSNSFADNVSGAQMLYLQPNIRDSIAHFTGDNFFITCFSTTETPLKWTDVDGNALGEEEGRIHVQEVGDGQYGLRLVFTNVEKEDAGVYTCSDDVSSVNFELYVYRAINFQDTPSIQHAPEGDTGLVLCNARSDVTLQISWYFKGRAIKNNAKYNIIDPQNLMIQNLSRKDAGVYKCKVFAITPQGVQNKDFDVTLRVQYAPEIVGVHKYTTYGIKGAKKDLACNVTAVPTPMFQWLFDEMIIHNNTDNFVIHNSDNSSTLQLVMDHADRQGQYICRANNALGEKEVIIDLIEGEIPGAPVLNVVGQDQGTVKLSITMKEEDKPTTVEDMSEYLEVTGYRVEYKLSSEMWDDASFQEFNIGERYELRNMSFNSEYILRASARNVAGYGNFSDEETYMTHSLQTASVISSASGLLSSLGLLLVSIFVISSL